MRNDRAELVTREVDMLSGQVISGPRLGIQSEVGRVVAAVGHVPRAQALELGAARHKRLLVARHVARRLADAYGEHVRVDCLVLVHAWHELEAGEVAC